MARLLLCLLLLLLRPTLQLLGDLVCRACGEHLFSAAAHAHGTHLSGPRVSGAAHDPALGVGGTVHTLKKSASAGGAGGSVVVAVYSEALSLRAGRAVTPSLFPGYTQTRVACARCEAAVGWYFSRAEGSAGGGTGSGKRAEAAASDAKPSGSGASVVVPFVEEEALARLQHLSTLPCLVHPNPLGWWTYSFCHTVSVEQYHEDTRWGMGVFEAERKKERLAPERPGYYTSHFYVRGQHCDETGKGRATEVQFYCCSAEAMAAGGAAARGVGGLPSAAGNAPFILDLTEPGGEGTCKYIMRVCVPALCAEHPLARALTAVFKAQRDKAAGLGEAVKLQAGVAPVRPQAAVGGSGRQADTGSGEAVIPPRDLTPPSAEYDPEAMPSAFYAAALSALAGEQEVGEVAGKVWGASGGPVQFR